MIIDSHQHLMFPTEFQIEKMDKAGVKKAVLFPTTPHPENVETLEEFKNEMTSLFKILSGKNTSEENKKRMGKDISDLVKVLKKYPEKFYGFGSVPLGISKEETVLWIKNHIVANGLKGVGEFTPGNDSQVRELETVFQALEEFHDLSLIWVHTFNPVTLNGIKILEDLTKKYSDTNVIFGHMGGYNWLEVITFVKEIPNAYIDLSAAFTTLGVKIALNEVPEKCLYSSDAPYGEPLLTRQMIEYLSSSEKIKKQVLGENILKLIEK